MIRAKTNEILFFLCSWVRIWLERKEYFFFLCVPKGKTNLSVLQLYSSFICFIVSKWRNESSFTCDKTILEHEFCYFILVSFHLNSLLVLYNNVNHIVFITYSKEAPKVYNPSSFLFKIQMKYKLKVFFFFHILDFPEL